MISKPVETQAGQAGQAQAVQGVSEVQITKTRQEGLALGAPVVTLANELEVSNAAEYAEADALLLRIRTAIKTVDGKLDPIIQPIRSGLDQLYALKRELHLPLDQAEEITKKKMAAWQLADRKRIADAEKAKAETEELLRRKALRKQEEAARLQQETEEAERKTREAGTARERKAAEEAADALRRQQQEAEAKAQEYDVKMAVTSARTVQGPLTAAGSRSGLVKKWRVTDAMAFIKGVAEGKIPIATVEISDVVVNRWFKADQGIVGGWPGVKLYDDVKISGRG